MWTNEQTEAMDSVLQWIIGQCEDQMVRGWLICERDFLRGPSYSGVPKWGGSWKPNLPTPTAPEKEEI